MSSAIESIRRLIAVYAQLLDDKRFAEWGELFTIDARFQVWGQTYSGRDEIVREIGGMQQERPGKHVVLSPIIDVLDDRTAKAWTDFSAFATTEEGAIVVATIARYYDDIVLDGGLWRFKRRVIVMGGESPLADLTPSPAR